MNEQLIADDAANDLHDQAGEYVLGTSSARQRQAMDERLIDDKAMQAAVHAWEERLLPLTALVAPVPPSTRLWHRIARSATARTAMVASTPPTAVLTAAPTAATTTTTTQSGLPVDSTVNRSRQQSRWRTWNSIGLWQALTAASFATAAMLAVVLADRAEAPLPQAQFMVVLVAPQDKAPGWVIQSGGTNDRQISLTPLASTVVPADKALEFWTKADGWSGPVSLGLVKPGQSVRIPLDRLPPLQPNQLFELTLEPSAGSPIGKPTGPIQFIGRAVKVM